MPTASTPRTAVLGVGGSLPWLGPPLSGWRFFYSFLPPSPPPALLSLSRRFSIIPLSPSLPLSLVLVVSFRGFSDFQLICLTVYGAFECVTLEQSCLIVKFTVASSFTTEMILKGFLLWIKRDLGPWGPLVL
ncbi:hypothetical protein CK203_002669 [Vitis vinifera]|uniref:Uncharacterized protein n=1 Tax=Vitis vinifera TaxID=29760 RepID=A0A438KH55_VITVI|nr:hypothetical protein CK203_002669 [Vitis vinifera]